MNFNQKQQYKEIIGDFFFELLKLLNQFRGFPLHSMGKAWKDKELTNRNYGNFNHTDERAGCCEKFPKSVISINKTVNAVHPTEKPVQLLEWLIKTYSNEGDMILDFCCGSGPTLKASVNLNRKCYANDISVDFCNITKQRME